MLFADSNSQGGRPTPASLSFLHFLSLHSTLLAWQALVCDLWSTPVVKRSLSHPSVRTEYTPIELTRTLFNVLSRALDCASALGRICRLHTPHLLMAARQTSIILTTAPPARAFLHEHGDRISRACHSSLRVVYSFQGTPILELFAVRVDRSYQNCNDHASQGDRRDSYVPARAA